MDGHMKSFFLIPISLLSPCRIPTSHQVPQIPLSRGLWEGVSTPIGTLKRKSNLFFTKIGHLFWKILVYSHPTRSLFFLIKVLTWVGNWGLEGGPYSVICNLGVTFFFSTTGTSDIFKPGEESKFGHGLKTNSISLQVPLGDCARGLWTGCGGRNFQCNFHLSGFPAWVQRDFINIMLLNFGSMARSRSNVF